MIYLFKFFRYRGGRTNIASGLEMAYELSFQSQNGDRPDVPNFAIVFTDGGANIRETETFVEATRLKNAGVHVTVVAVGRDMNNVALRGKYQLNLTFIKPISHHDRM